MLDNQSTKTLIIFDPYTTNGFLLAKKILAKGYKIYLYTNRLRCDFLFDFPSNDLDPKLIIYDLSKGFSDNLVPEFFFRLSEYLIIIDSLPETILFLDDTCGFSYELYATQLKEKLLFEAKENHVKTVDTGIWHFSLENLDELVSRIFDFIQHDSEPRLFLNTLQCDFFLMENSLYLDLLENTVDNQPTEDLITAIENSRSSIRDVLRLVFDELGAEIEFCGRAEYERGVIVDYEDDILTRLIFNTSKIRLGNTIVKINELNYNEISAVLKGRKINESLPKSNHDILLKIKRLIKSKFCNCLKIN